MAAILSVFPLDEFVEHPLERMEVDGDAARTTPEQDAVLRSGARPHIRGRSNGACVPRLDFYERARAAYAVVHTLEPQPWACFILTKGVVFPD